MRLSIVVPCYNEEPSIAALHAALTTAATALPDDEVEILFVDDGSTDGTLAALRDLATRDPAVRYISFSRNFGKEAAMLAGLQRTQGDAVVLLDADLQHPPHLLPQMVALYKQGYDQVVAVRDRSGEPTLRRIPARLFYRAVNRWVDVRLHDGAGDFRLLSREVVEALLALPEYHRFSKGLFSWVGFDTISLPFPHEPRQAGTSTWSFGKLFNYALDGLLSFNHKPLRLVVYVGLLQTLIALGYAIWVVVKAAVEGVDMPGYATLISAVIGMGGVQLMVLGVIGEYIGRIYHESKRRPHFLIRESDSTRQAGRDRAARPRARLS
ncbi:glycosyltransferase family 2 protein [Micromonospora endophytica]|uniref:glycosyltransferase family 2 protein n=1 Tax=Micromonospora endophytica TaxID=515350 RepID=UPI001BB44D4F|nr:glycosyltransferase family 2 protein [Micromonospora endophytica]BCJ62131.1 glycosyl transferase [Micromonospora endophytica]